MKSRFAAALALLAMTAQSAFAAPFSDLETYEHYFEGVYQNKVLGFVNGYDDGSFRGQDSIKRAELAKMLVLGSGVTEAEMELALNAAGEDAFFTDVTLDDYEQGKWYAVYVGYSKAQGWINGYPDGSFKPSDPVNVVEALKMVTEVMHSTPPSIYEGDSWHDLYVNYLTAPEVGVLVQPFFNGGWMNFRYTSAGLGDNNDELSRAAVAELIYRMQEMSFEPFQSFAELDSDPERGFNYTVDSSTGNILISDLDYGLELVIPAAGLNPSNLRLYVSQPSGFINDYQSEWQVLMPDTSGGDYSENGYILLTGVTIADEIYFANSGQSPLSEPVEGYAHPDMTSSHGLLYIPYCAQEVPDVLLDIRNNACSGGALADVIQLKGSAFEESFECGMDDEDC